MSPQARRSRAKKAEEEEPEQQEEEAPEEEFEEPDEDEFEDDEDEGVSTDEREYGDEDAEEEQPSASLGDVNLSITEQGVTVSMPRSGNEEDAFKRLAKLFHELNK